jgi:chondroitin 4-sulfotransferase 11
VSYKFKNHINDNPYVTTFVSEGSKIIHLRPGRTAGISMTSYMSSLNVIEVSKPYFLGNGINEWVENITDEEVKNDYFVFTFVRNPFDRLISAWNMFVYKGKVESNFEKFIKDRGVGHLLYEDGKFTNDHWFPQSYYVEYEDGESFVDFTGKFENLKEDWPKVAKKFNINQNLYNVFLDNQSNHDYYRNYYTEELVSIVSDVYKRDLELFDYEF